MKTTVFENGGLEIVLSNGNTIFLHESEEGVLEITNVSQKNSDDESFGIMIFPVNVSTISIIPEG